MAPPQSSPNSQETRVNGEHTTNGGTPTTGSEGYEGKFASKSPNGPQLFKHESSQLPNGAKVASTPAAQSLVWQADMAPLEILQTVSRNAYLPMARLISRRAQTCWDQLSKVVEDLSQVEIPPATQDQNASQFQFVQNNQSRANLDKKDRLLNFANDQKSDFIKLLVLMKWSKDIEDVRKTTALNLWLNERRLGFYHAIQEMSYIRRDSAMFQVPNPDLETARDVLALGEGRRYPALQEYQEQKLHTAEDALRTLDILDEVLCEKLSLSEDLPDQLRDYSIRDGRVTFHVQDEFEIDMSVTGEAVDSPFGLVDFRFLFSPAPAISDRLHSEVTNIANSAIQLGGLLKCYEFFQSLCLSYRLNELYKQALELSQGFWSGHLNVELHRRTLVIQYWLKRPMHKTWVEIGVTGGHHSSQNSQQPSEAALGVRWMREGKEVKDLRIMFDRESLSVESLLRQVIAQHIDYMFDAIYDKLSSILLYAKSDLELEQQTSNQDPSGCMLMMQLSRRHRLKTQIEPITGTLYLQPWTAETDRAQQHLNRARNPIDEFSARVQHLRSETVEREVLHSIAEHGWERLQVAVLGLPEVRALTHTNTSKVNFFRLPQWTRNFMLALTHGPDGDLWWLVHQQGKNLTSQFLSLKCRPLHLETNLSSSYFGRLAVYVSGMVVVQSTLSSLDDFKLKYNIPDVPDFSTQAGFQNLSFELNRIDPFTPEQDQVVEKFFGPVRPRHQYPLLGRTVSICYQGLNSDQNAQLIGKARLMAKSSVLRKLLSASIDPTLKVDIPTGQLEIMFQVPVGKSIVGDFTRKLQEIATVLACVDAAQAYSTSAIKALSLSDTTVQYLAKPEANLVLKLHFESAAQRLRAELLPVQSNPHLPLLPFLNLSLASSSRGLADKISAMLSLLASTYPLLTFLQKLQHGRTQDTTSKLPPKLRVHVLCRHLKLFAIQYFSNPSPSQREKADSNSRPEFLARFEILPRLRGKKTVWLVRPAIEEFQSYNRPSFVSESLREKVQQEVFAKRSEGVAWLPLDGGAVVPMDQPEKLLAALHEVISTWVLEAESSRPANDKKIKAEERKAQAGHDSKAQVGVNGQAINNARPANMKRQTTAQGNVPNGVNKQQANRQQPNGMAKSNQQNRPSGNTQNNNDVITID